MLAIVFCFGSDLADSGNLAEEIGRETREMITKTLGRSLASYDSGAAAASALQLNLWTGRAKRGLGDEIATLIGIERPLTDIERGFFDRLEEWLSA